MTWTLTKKKKRLGKTLGQNWAYDCSVKSGMNMRGYNGFCFFDERRYFAEGNGEMVASLLSRRQP